MAGRPEAGAMGALPDGARRVAEAVDPDRVMWRIEELARIGRTARGGVTRPAFSEEEARATALFAGWMQGTGLTVAFDDFGNLFGSTDDNAPGAAVCTAGSHLDSVPDGGKYDGPLGIIGALETIEAMRAAGVTPRRPMELIVWRAEEPGRFAAGRIGSQVFAGQLTIAELLEQGAGFDLAGWLGREADRPRRAAGRTLTDYLELHIEQGRRLEEAGAQIGVVTAIAAATRVRAVLQGAADHSGATPMGLRRDALCAAAELILATEAAGLAESAAGSVATAVIIRAEPGAMNVVPGRVELFLDVRGIVPASIAATVERIRAEGQAIGARRGIALEWTELTRGTPVTFDEGVVAGVESTAWALGYSALRLPSGAGHDAQTVAPLARAGMIFVPSAGGISHAPDEYTPPADIERGVKTLAAAWARLALEGE
ncbi:MAG: Zn-dependent hydrolase [Chloroflexota bacterium]|nr:Zn-dependent hydrolase [Chloroflexota bacterium]